MKIAKTTLENKLRNYSLLAGTLVAAANAADAQVSHHRLNPAVVLDTNNSFYSLDLNGDAVQDYLFAEFQSAGFGLAGIGVAGTNSIVGSVRSFSSAKLAYPYVINTGDKIGASNKWFNVNDFKGSGANTYYPRFAYSYGVSIILHKGKWEEGETAKFVGLKFKKGGKNYYGWARITIPALSAKSITILDYAYQSTPETFILAGDTGTTTGITSSVLENANIYASGKKVFVKYPGAVTSGINIIVRDITGKEVYKTQTNEELFELNLNSEASGTYIVSVISGTAQESRKVVIE